MNREELIEFKAGIEEATAAAEWACHEAQTKMAEAGVGAYTGAACMVLSGLLHMEDLRPDAQLGFVELMAVSIEEICVRLESDGVDVSQWDNLRHGFKLDSIAE